MYDDGPYDSAYDFNLMFKRNTFKEHIFLNTIFATLYSMYDDGLYNSAYYFNLLFKRNTFRKYIFHS